MFIDVVKKAGFFVIALIVIWFTIILLFGLFILLVKILFVIFVVSLVILGYKKVWG